jgi:hydrogenase maturation protease
MPRVLIIAYGNPLRSDDSVAWRAAEGLQKMFPNDDLEILCLHQLGPELADSLRNAECVIFVDAASGTNPGQIEIKELTSAPRSAKAPAFGHALSPEVIVTLAAQLYHARPRAFSATIAGQNFEHGESLSPAVAGALPEFIARIERLVGELLSNH